MVILAKLTMFVWNYVVFSLGMILFELMHPMSTAMERADLFSKVSSHCLPVTAFQFVVLCYSVAHCDFSSLYVVHSNVVHCVTQFSMKVRMFLQARTQLLPPQFLAQFPLESSLIFRMLSSDPKERPSTSELLQSPVLVTRKPEAVHDQKVLQQTIR